MLQQLAGTIGVPAQQLATRSASGKTITGGMPIVNPANVTSNLDWETGVRFTPRSQQASWQITGIMVAQNWGMGPGMDFSLTDMYQRDELFVYGNKDDVSIGLYIDMPPGDYVITVELSTVMSQTEGLPYECTLCSSAWQKLEPMLDPSAVSQGISSYIGTLHVPSFGRTAHFIRLPQGPVLPTVMGIFRGISLTRL